MLKGIVSFDVLIESSTRSTDPDGPVPILGYISGDGVAESSFLSSFTGEGRYIRSVILV